MENYASLMFHDVIAELQKQDGSYEMFQKMYPHRTQTELSQDDIAYIRNAMSFYIASTNPAGWPYIQHRGGARGFVDVIDNHTIACADYPGNRQFITMGNLTADDKVSLFFMDYTNKARLKIQGHATLSNIEDCDPAFVQRLDTAQIPAQRILTVKVVSMDWNCPKYIPTLYPEQAVKTTLAKLQAENAQLRAELASLKSS